MNARRRRALGLLLGLCSAAAALAIALLSVMPPMRITGRSALNSGVYAHVFAYASLCLLVCMWLRVSALTRRPALVAAGACALYGFLIECLQYLVPYRTFQVVDIVLNCVAASLAALLWRAAVKALGARGA